MTSPSPGSSRKSASARGCASRPARASIDFSDFGSEWSPKASAVYRLSERQRLRASAGHGFRPPFFGELYLNHAARRSSAIPTCEPETAQYVQRGLFVGGHADAGLRRLLPRLGEERHCRSI